MRVCVVIGAAALSAGMATIVAAQQPGERQAPQVVTTGQGEVRVTPDRATVSIGVETRAATASAAADENARKQRMVIDAIKAAGIPSEQISTLTFSVQPETQYDPAGKGPPKTGSYLVSNTVNVELRRMDQVGRVIDIALAGGSNTVRSLSYGLSSSDSARRAATALAVADARATAEVMARAAGGTLGELIEITALDRYEEPRIVAAIPLRATAALAPTPLEPGSQVVRAGVSARWRFLSGRP